MKNKHKVRYKKQIQNREEYEEQLYDYSILKRNLQ